MKDIVTLKSFLKRNPIVEFSAACLEYSYILQPEVEAAANSMIEEQGLLTNEARLERASILETNSPKEIMRLLRTDVSACNKSALREKALSYEDAILPEIKRRILTTQLDVFVENALHIFVRCKDNPSEWLIAHLDDIRSPYARSMMCLALGFRADLSAVSFLMRHFKALRDLSHDDLFEQGPLLALSELAARFQTD